MAAVQERVLELADKFGIKEKISHEAFEKGLRREHKKTAIQLRKAEMSINFIAQITGLKESWLERFFKKIRI